MSSDANTGLLLAMKHDGNLDASKHVASFEPKLPFDIICLVGLELIAESTSPFLVDGLSEEWSEGEESAAEEYVPPDVDPGSEPSSDDENSEGAVEMDDTSVRLDDNDQTFVGSPWYLNDVKSWDDRTVLNLCLSSKAMYSALHPRLIRDVIARKINLSCCQNFHGSLVDYATEMNDPCLLRKAIQIAKFLPKPFETAFGRPHDFHTILRTVALWSGGVESLEILLSHGKQWWQSHELPDGHSVTQILHEAFGRKNYDIVDVFIRNGIPLEDTLCDAFVANIKDFEMLEKAIQYGVDINKRDNRDRTLILRLFHEYLEHPIDGTLRAIDKLASLDVSSSDAYATDPTSAETRGSSLITACKLANPALVAALSRSGRDARPEAIANTTDQPLPLRALLTAPPMRMLLKCSNKETCLFQKQSEIRVHHTGEIFASYHVLADRVHFQRCKCGIDWDEQDPLDPGAGFFEDAVQHLRHVRDVGADMLRCAEILIAHGAETGDMAWHAGSSVRVPAFSILAHGIWFSLITPLALSLLQKGAQRASRRVVLQNLKRRLRLIRGIDFDGGRVFDPLVELLLLLKGDRMEEENRSVHTTDKQPLDVLMDIMEPFEFLGACKTSKTEP